MASLQSLCDGNSLSLLKSSDQVSVSETLDWAPVLKVAQVNPGNPSLDSLRASGVSVSRVFPAAPVLVVQGVEPTEQTDPKWGGSGKW